MIYDWCVDWRRYVPKQAAPFCQAMEFLRTFTPDTEDGQHVLLEDKIFANVQSYSTKPLNEGLVEYHREFIDVQTILAGEEDIYYVPTATLREVEGYHADGDYGFFAFYGDVATKLHMVPGNMAIFFPEEGHMPCIRCGAAASEVKKIVVKIHKSLLAL